MHEHANVQVCDFCVPLHVAAMCNSRLSNEAASGHDMGVQGLCTTQQDVRGTSCFRRVLDGIILQQVHVCSCLPCCSSSPLAGATW